ncbi:MAG: tRNA pseudouridine(54/55) synthase Pus10, partial [Desulfurococcaceae archaeon]
VYEVKARLINGRIYEALIKAEGGLYVKELISGDRGRTDPSFTSFLNASNTCIELDVIGVCDI